MAKPKKSGRVLTVRLQEREHWGVTKNLEVRVGMVDRENPNEPCHPEYAGSINSRGERFIADYGAVGTDFIQATWSSNPNQWDTDYRLGHHTRYGGSFMDFYKVEALAKTLAWMGKQVSKVIDQHGCPGSVDEAVMLLAAAIDADYVYVRNADDEWLRYENAIEYRAAIRRLESYCFEPKVA